MTIDHSSHFHRPATVTWYKEVFTAAKEFINERIVHDKLLLDDFCVERGYSRRSVQRAMSWHSTSWSGLLLRQRMIKASELLRTTQKSVDDVARAVGYRDDRSFARAFSKHNGVSPDTYRKTVRDA